MSRPAHVVIVDDDEAYRELLTLAVQEFTQADRITGHGSATGAIAAICDDAEPAAVLLDLHMPELTGAQVTRRLRERGCASTIVVVSAALSEHERAECMRAGADAVVVKPNTFLALGQALQQALCEEGSDRLRGR